MPSGAEIGTFLQDLRTSEFPWTAETTYLNNAQVGPIPERTRLALEAFNARRTAPHLLSDEEMFEILGEARARVADLIGAHSDQIALTQNTSYGLTAAARGLPLAAGDVVVLSDREFPANVYPWLRLRDRGVEVELAPCTVEGWPDEDRLLDRVTDPRVRVLAVSFVQFANGYRASLERLGSVCRSEGTYLVVDGIQGIGHVPLDVGEVPVDVLACGGQKWLLSPWGTGFLYVRPDLIGEMSPAVTGWMAFEGTDDLEQLTTYDATLRTNARRFELNTLPFQDFYGFIRSVELLLDIGVGRIAEHTDELYRHMLRWADERAFSVVSPRDTAHTAGIFCFEPPNPIDAHRALAQAGVVCSLREGALRLSPHVYNTIEEIDRLIDILEGERLEPSPAAVS